MTLSLILACLWAIAAAIVALLPMRQQFPPGITLLVSAPFLLIYLGRQHNAWIVLFGAFAVISMFRRPLFFMVHRLLHSKGEQT